MENIAVVTSGAGAAGVVIIKLLLAMGLRNVVMCDSQGAIYRGRDNLNSEKAEMAELSNKEMKKGSLADVIRGAGMCLSASQLREPSAPA